MNTKIFINENCSKQLTCTYSWSSSWSRSSVVWQWQLSPFMHGLCLKKN